MRGEARAYYNELDPYAAQWLRNLIDGGHIAPGDVDERSIVDVRPSDLEGYAQCHFFAGIGGWSYAARLAGWPDDKPLWTGSCPCQPFSVAGKQEGQADERHLWPVLFDLIRACKPPVVMGEQVAAAVGKDWLDGVHSDLEAIGYACGAAVVPACAVDAPHRRDRLWFVADRNRSRPLSSAQPGVHRCEEGAGPRDGEPQRRGLDGSALCCDPVRYDRGECDPRCRFLVANADQSCASAERAERGEELCGAGGDPAAGDGEHVAYADKSGSQGRSVLPERADERSAWSGRLEWLSGADGKARRVEPGIRLLAHGVPARVGKLRAYGNAIVPQVAAEVIGAFLDVEGRAA